MQRIRGWVILALALGASGCNAAKEADTKSAETDSKDKGGEGKSKDSPKTQPPATAEASAAPHPTTPGLPARRARVRAASTTAMGGRLTTDQVEQAVAENLDAFTSCTSSDATVTMRALIGGNGKVIEASSTRSVPDDARLRDCFARAFGRISFPTSGDGQAAPITFDLVLTPP